MDFDGTRLALGAEVGLGIGALILVGWIGTRWLLRGRLAPLSWAHVARSLAIIATSTGAYALFSYSHQPPSPPLSSAVTTLAAVATSAAPPPAGRAAGGPPGQPQGAGAPPGAPPRAHA